MALCLQGTETCMVGRVPDLPWTEQHPVIPHAQEVRFCPKVIFYWSPLLTGDNVVRKTPVNETSFSRASQHPRPPASTLSTGLDAAGCPWKGVLTPSPNRPPSRDPSCLSSGTHTMQIFMPMLREMMGSLPAQGLLSVPHSPFPVLLKRLFEI